MLLPGYLEFGIEDMPDDPLIRRRVAAFPVRWGYHAEALPLVEELSAAQPASILLRAWWSECLLGLDRVSEAAAVVADLTHAYPRSTLAGIACTDLLLHQGALSEAHSTCREILGETGGHSIRAWEMLARRYLTVGDVDEALACCQCHAALARERSPDREVDGYPARYLRLLAAVQIARADRTQADKTLDTCAAVESAEAGDLNALICTARGLPISRSTLLGTRKLALPRRAVVQHGRGPADPASMREPGHRPSDKVGTAPSCPAGSRGGQDKATDPSRMEDDPGHPADALRTELRDVFGYADFLPGQREVIGRLLAGQDVLAVLPTGSGKSLCYQLPALCLPRAVVVISPLIALMRDQVENLPRELSRVSTVINHTIDAREMAARLEGIARGRFPLVYAAPERLRQEPFLHALRRAGISLFVVDEAHCVSLWGHDFRPDYAFIGAAVEMLSRPTLLALTATATAKVQEEIADHLGRKLTLVRTSIARPNLRLGVARRSDEEAKLGCLASLVAAESGSTIVYARAREKCEEIACLLRERRVAAIHYHAGMDPEERDHAQDAFMGGKAQVVCATVAFGMGIDKADIRLVAHHNLPKSIESYWQEAGRAGRDGRPSRCVLLATEPDAGVPSWWVEQDAIRCSVVEQVLRAIQGILGGPGPGRILLDDLARETCEEEKTIRAALALLDRTGLLRRHLDVPRTVTLCCSGRGDATFARFVQAARLRPGQRISLDTLEICERTGIAADSIEGQLLAWRDCGCIDLHTSGRDLLLSLPDPPAGAPGYLERLVVENRRRQDARAERIRAYARSRRCRHAFIANEFGEAMQAPCGACDVCAPPDPSGLP